MDSTSKVLLAIAVAVGIGSAVAETKPLRIIVPAAAGGPTDSIARIIAPALSKELSQPVVVENRGGAGGIIGTEAVAKAVPDGNTIGLVFISHATNPALHATLPYDTLKDFASIALVGQQPLLLVTNPSIKAANVRELLDASKAQMGGMLYAADTASAPHLAAELLKHETGASFTLVPYKGNGPALNDTIAGHVPFMFNTINTSLPHVKAGRLKALAVTGARRSPLAPDIPTMAESGFPNVEVSAWYGFLGPSALPKESAARLSAAIAAALKSPDVRDRFAEQGIESADPTPQAMDAFIRSEVRRWSTVIRAAGISVN